MASFFSGQVPQVPQVPQWPQWRMVRLQAVVGYRRSFLNRPVCAIEVTTLTLAGTL